MKKTTWYSRILSYGMLLFITVSIVFAQSDNDFQKFLAKIQPILGKNVENLNKEDMNLINSAIEISPNSFGEANSRLCVRIIEQAKQKKREYDEFIDSKKSMSKTIDELETETDLRMQAEAREGELLIENAELKTVVEELKNKVAKFEQQAKKLTRANQKLRTENMNAKELLQTSSDLIAQMLMLMPKVSLDDATMNDLPQTLRDSLEDAQCGVAQLLKSNFIITIQQLKANQIFIDTAIAYFAANQKHSGEIRIYIDNGTELVNRLRTSGISCAVGYASDIETEMNDFLLMIENGNLQTQGFSILDNLIWIAPVCLILLFGIILLLRKTPKK